jgi:DNA-binding response OmpR family regulator
MARILLVEPDERIRQLLVGRMRAHGYEVTPAAANLGAIQRAITAEPDVVVIDLTGGGGDPSLVAAVSGLTAAAVTVMSPRRDQGWAARLLNAGADAVLPRPCTLQLLEASIRSLLRRTTRPEPGATVIGRLRIDGSGREAYLGERALHLSPLEFDLLHYLAQHRGRVVSKRELMQRVWHLPDAAHNGTVGVHIAWLRRKLGESASEPAYLRTVRGLGVKLVDPEAPDAQHHEPRTSR